MKKKLATMSAYHLDNQTTFCRVGLVLDEALAALYSRVFISIVSWLAFEY